MGRRWLIVQKEVLQKKGRGVHVSKLRNHCCPPRPSRALVSDRTTVLRRVLGWDEFILGLYILRHSVNGHGSVILIPWAALAAVFLWASWLPVHWSSRFQLLETTALCFHGRAYFGQQPLSQVALTNIPRWLRLSPVGWHLGMRGCATFWLRKLRPGLRTLRPCLRSWRERKLCT